MEAATEQQGLEPREAILAAAERMLVGVGHAGITTRKLAAEAGVNPGLVHYYFGSMEEVLLQVLERFSARLLERQRALYAAEVPFVEKWRAAMRFIDVDVEAGYPKVWFELQSLAWNKPALGERVRAVQAAWWGLLEQAFDAAIEGYGLDRDRFPVAALVALVVTFNQGLMLNRLSGVETGHRVLLEMVERWLEELEERQGR